MLFCNWWIIIIHNIQVRGLIAAIVFVIHHLDFIDLLYITDLILQPVAYFTNKI